MDEKQLALSVSLRSMEWSKWPIFISQPVIPILLFLTSPLNIGIGVLTCAWLWCLIRHRFVSYRLMVLGVFWTRLKWLTIPAATVVFWYHHQWLLGTFSLFTPLLIPLLAIFVPPAKRTTIETAIWAQIV